jgi:hypothetical protein
MLLQWEACMVHNCTVLLYYATSGSSVVQAHISFPVAGLLQLANYYVKQQ